MTKRIYIIQLTVFALYCALYGYSTQNVHIVIIDGARYSETFGDSTHQNIPYIWNRLKPKSTICTRFYNDRLTYTAAGHASIISGVWQNIPNDDSQRLTTPTLFEYFRKENNLEATDNFVILGKDKLHILSSSMYPEYGEKFGASVQTSTSPYSDTIAWQNFKRVLTTYHPRLTITNLPQVDYSGHNTTWKEYLRSIRYADSIINEMWSLIQNDSFYKNKTTLIVTNDHGRHLSDWSSHGDDCDGCRHIMLMILGPDSKAGDVDSVRRTQIDIAPTVGELLNFSTPLCKGTSIIPIQAPAKPLLTAPKDKIVNQPSETLLMWNSVKRVTSYQVQLSLDSSFNRNIINDSVLIQNSFKSSPLALNTPYYWHVRSINSSGAGNWSETREFTTASVISPNVILSAPENAAVIINDSVNLAWNILPNSADRFYIQIALDSQMTRAVFFDSTTLLSINYKLSKNKTTFWWRVKPHFISGWARWTETSQFFVDIGDKMPRSERFCLDLDLNHKTGNPLLLKYELPASAPVTIRLYTVNGTLVRTLFKNILKSDSHTLAINNLSFSSGHYLLDFNAGQYRATRGFFVY
jgi:hypothetical protein